MHDLFFGTGVGHSIMLISFVIGMGMFLGRFKLKGVSLGSTWILFIGIIVSHFGFRSDPGTLHFVKEFGLILFVFSIGLQVGPGFFHSFKSGGVKMNLMAVFNVLMAVVCTLIISQVTGEDLPTMTGVMSGAVTNTPGLGAAQQTYIDVASGSFLSQVEASRAASALASGYAVAYPLGVIGVLLLLIVFKGIFKVDIDKERKAIEASESGANNARRMHVKVANPALFGKKLNELPGDAASSFIVSRIMRDGEISIPDNDTVLEKDDILLLVVSTKDVDALHILFGEEVNLHVDDWLKQDHKYVVRKLVVTKSRLTGRKIRELDIRHLYGVNITRIIRSGVEIVATPNSYIQMGDRLLAVGPEVGIEKVSKLVGNTSNALDKPNIVPIFLGVVFGIIFGSIPIKFPGIPQAIKLGLAGGPLIIAILLGYFGPRYRITTYTTTSANLMMREMGICLFLAAVGIGAGENFVSSILGGGYLWIVYGLIITLVPVTLTIIISRLVFKFNYFQISGLVSGSTTNPPVLAFAQSQYGSEYTSVNYATVYPLTMFMRVLAAQLLILIAFA